MNETNETGRPIFGYRLDVRLSIERIRKDPGRDFWSHNHGQDGRLSVEEDIMLGRLDFAGLMGVLAKLHEAVNAIRPTPEKP